MDFATISAIITDIAGFFKDFAAKFTLFIEGIKSGKWYNDEKLDAIK